MINVRWRRNYMRDKDTNIGAAIDSSFTIHGDKWELTDRPEKEQVATEVAEEEFIEEEVNLEEMTNRELEAFAKEHNTTLTSDDKRNKETRINAIAKAFE